MVPSKSTLDAWAHLGNPGWEWEAFSKSLAKSYTLTAPHGVKQGDGPLKVTVPKEDSQWQWPKAWRDTLEGLGHPTNLDAFSGQHYGGLLGADTLDPVTKKRSYAANAHLGQAKSRENLIVWTETLVNKINFTAASDVDGDVQATGVQYTTKSGETREVTASEEVIITAGTIGSPKLLEFSGVGDERLLKAHGINVVIANSFVGENLQNHPMCFLSFEVPEGEDEGFATLDSVRRRDPTALAAAMDAYSKGAGPLSRSGSNIAAELALPGIDTPDGKRQLESMLADAVANLAHSKYRSTGGFDKALELYVRSVLESSTEASGHYITVPVFTGFNADGSMASPPAGQGSFYTFGLSLAHPLSRGSVHVKDSTSVAIDPNYFSHPLDIAIFARHLQYLATTLTKAEPLASHLVRKLGTDPSLDLEKFQDIEFAKEYIRSNAAGAHHLTGTCAMMPKELGGVVDSKLRLYGCKNLRICDASIMPITPGVNPQATVSNFEGISPNRHPCPHVNHRAFTLLTPTSVGVRNCRTCSWNHHVREKDSNIICRVSEYVRGKTCGLYVLYILLQNSK